MQDYPFYSIRTSGQIGRILTLETGPLGQYQTKGLIINESPHGWTAYRSEKSKDDAGRHDPVGEGVNVNRLINQSDGGAKIAELLGLQ